ncbi:hypothetical protein [Pantoea agglomerans]|uniref:hypothetical protein n=1 Tax=Enterobacter agglomerans TaxID=549 RepID=UPI0021D7A423|nr:hypothetical protein [Pantoea agglomerans]
MSEDKKQSGKAGHLSNPKKIDEGREFRTDGRQTFADGFETRGAQLQAPSRDVDAGRQTGPINLAPTNFQSPKVPKIPAKK